MEIPRLSHLGGHCCRAVTKETFESRLNCGAFVVNFNHLAPGTDPVVYPNMRSVMMDMRTLNDLRALTGRGEKAGTSPSNLNPEERAAFEEVKRTGKRLEQEKVPLDYSIEVIGRFAKLQKERSTEA